MIGCNTDPVSIEWSTGFRARARRDRIPISGVLELTSRCNLRCRHCYLGSQDARHSRHEQEMDTDAVKASLREWADAGCLYLLITGGDPLLRPDFSEIYRTARELGLVVTVFCNGTLIDASLIRLFQELPPRRVEVSLYGATRETYELVTQVPGSHDKAWAGIRRLLDGGVRVWLKTVVLTLNEHELDAMEEQANTIGVPFRTDAALIPCLTADEATPLDFRVAPDRVIAHEMKNSKQRKRWQDQVEKSTALPERSELYGCGAGATAFHSSPSGELSPCLVASRYRVSPAGRPFRELWDHELNEIQKRVKTPGREHLSGGLRGACTSCPAANYLETGDEGQESDYVLETTQLRYRAVLASIGEDK